MPDQAFTGDLVVLRRMARVRQGTVVAMFTEGERPLLRLPGEILLPDRNPLKHRVSVMPISTQPVRLRVRVVDLRTLDGQHLDAIEMSVTVQLNAAEPSRILELAARRGPETGLFLNEQVREGVENTARAGIKMSTRVELQQQGLTETLRERWLPRSFVGLLGVIGFEVVEEEWAAPTVVHRPHVSPPATGAARPGAARPGADRPGADRSRSESEPTGAFSARSTRGAVDSPDSARSAALPGWAEPVLSRDPRLLTVWRRRLPATPRGIASARIGDDGCVVAVIDADPPAFESRQLWEDFAGVLDDRHVKLLLCHGRTYEEIIRSWFSQLGLSPRLDAQLEIEVGRDRIDLTLPAELADDVGSRWAGLDGPPVAALRRLLAPAAGRPGRKLSIGYGERS